MLDKNKIKNGSTKIKLNYLNVIFFNWILNLITIKIKTENVKINSKPYWIL